MALEQTITIVNNSGKIIKTGKQLYSIFKDAQGTYKEKKAEIKSEKALQRSQSYDPRDLPPPQQPRYYDDGGQYYPPQQPRYIDDGDRYYPPRASDQRSVASSRRSGRSRSVHSQSREPYYDTRSRAALTMDNLKTHSEVSSVTPSRAPSRSYANPYAETIPMDLAIPAQSQLARTEMRSVAPSAYGPGGGAMVQRNRSTGELVRMKPHKEIDMDLAYGNIPPDLAERTDLDPHYGGGEEKQAKALVHRVEGLLTEAKCIHHSATTTMAQLQKDPDSAAAVALSLAELSKLVKKTSPAFLTLLKSGSPAVFSLLSSPHFLIGTSIAVGVTVVCFGGWKIVQRVKEAQQAREALAYENVHMDRPAPSRTQSEYAPRRAPTEYSAGMDEALIIEDDLSDLSSIETWRRGIVPFGEDERADMELITPLANQDNKDRYGDDFDVKSRRSTRTSKTHESHRSHRSHRSEASERSERSERSHRSHRSRRDDESIADSERSHRSSRSKRSERIETRSIDSRRSRKDDTELVLRPKSNRNSNNMLKALFKSKDKKERELVMA
ncbi:hypothetical protein ACHAPT_008343 [Fusarium lateritium]